MGAQERAGERVSPLSDIVFKNDKKKKNRKNKFRLAEMKIIYANDYRLTAAVAYKILYVNISTDGEK